MVLYVIVPIFSNDTSPKQVYNYLLLVHPLFVNCCWAEHEQGMTMAHVGSHHILEGLRLMDSFVAFFIQQKGVS
jgi:hypothetical protein